MLIKERKRTAGKPWRDLDMDIVSNKKKGTSKKVTKPIGQGAIVKYLLPILFSLDFSMRGLTQRPLMVC